MRGTARAQGRFWFAGDSLRLAVTVPGRGTRSDRGPPGCHGCRPGCHNRRPAGRPSAARASESASVCIAASLYIGQVIGGVRRAVNRCKIGKGRARDTGGISLNAQRSFSCSTGCKNKRVASDKYLYHIFQPRTSVFVLLSRQKCGSRWNLLAPNARSKKTIALPKYSTVKLTFRSEMCGLCVERSRIFENIPWNRHYWCAIVLGGETGSSMTLLSQFASCQNQNLEH